MIVNTARVPSAVLLILAAAACGPDDRGARDASAPDPVELSLSAEPVLSVGTVDGAPEDALFRVRGAERLSDGTLMIVNEGTSELRLYDAAGKHLRSIGREGEGPGEFGVLTSARVIRGDTIVTWEARASLELPPGMEILSFGEDAVVVLTEDELDIERVHVFRLERPQTGGAPGPEAEPSGGNP